MSTTANRRRVDLIDRRVGLMFGVFVLLLAAGITRALYLGLFRAGALKAAAATEHVQTETVPAIRGTITDRNGNVLALSEGTAEVIADPYLIANPPTGTTKVTAQALADRLAGLLQVPASVLLTKLTAPGSGYELLARNVPAATATRIDKLIDDGTLNGISERPTEERVYPHGDELAPVLGWIGANGKGSGGLEYLFNRRLAGHDGLRRTVHTPSGQVISVENARRVVSGQSIALTVNAQLQAEVEKVLAGVGRRYAAKGATAIVTNPRNGQVLALANWPSFNPGKPLTQTELANNTEDQAVGFTYEPGSTFKAITVAAALQEGLVTPNTVFDVPPYLRAYGKTVSDAEPHGYENMTVAQILKVSSNIGADLIGRRLGPYRFAAWVRRFGFGRQTGIRLPDESQGILLPTSQYNGLSMLNMPFGQGESVTPMQMVQAYDAIADGGVLRTPQIVDSIGGRTLPQPRGRRIISPQVAGELRDMLRGVLADGGTASGAAIPGYDLAGKTGTANVAVDGKYSDSDYIASFIGMVPASNPKLVVAVVVNDPKDSIYGGSVAAPAFQKIVGWAVPYFGIDPCPQPCPASAMNPAMPNSL